MANKLNIEIGTDLSGLKAGLADAVSSSMRAGKAMGDAFTFDKGKEAAEALTGRLANIGRESVGAAQNVAGIRRELSTVIQDGADLDKTVAMVREMSVRFGLNSNAVADAVQHMRQFGDVSEKTLTSVVNLAAGTRMSIEQVGGNFELIATGGQGAERAIMQMARAANISVEALRQAGAEVSGGKLLTDTPEQARKAKEALEKLADTKYAGAAEKMVSSSQRLSGELEDLKANVGESAAKWEAWAKGGLASVVHAVNDGLSPNMKAAIGIIADFGGQAASIGGSVIQLAGQVAQVVSAAALLAAGRATNAAAAGVETLATEAETAAHIANAGALDAEAAAQGRLAASKTAGAGAGRAGGTPSAVSSTPAVVGVGSVGFLATIVALGAAAWKTQNAIDDMNKTAVEGEQAMAQGAVDAMRDLGKHMDMVDKTADQYRAMGKTAADVTPIIQEMQAQIGAEKENGRVEEAEKWTASLHRAMEARAQLAQAEGSAHQTTVDTKAALDATTHAYAMNQATIEDLIAAHHARVAALKTEIEQVGENTVKGQELLKEQRTEEEALHKAQEDRVQAQAKALEDLRQKEADLANDQVAKAQQVLREHEAAGTRTIADTEAVKTAKIQAAQAEYTAALKALEDREAAESRAGTLTEDRAKAINLERKKLEDDLTLKVQEAGDEQVASVEVAERRKLDLQHERVQQSIHAIEDENRLLELRRARGENVDAALLASALKRNQADMAAEMVVHQQKLRNADAIGRQAENARHAAAMQHLQTQAVLGQAEAEQRLGQSQADRLQTQKKAADAQLEVIDTTIRKLELQRAEGVNVEAAMAAAIEQANAKRKETIALDRDAQLATERDPSKRDAIRARAAADVEKANLDREQQQRDNHNAELDRIEQLANKRRSLIASEKTALDLRMAEEARLGKSTEESLRAEYELRMQQIELEHQAAVAAAEKLRGEERALALQKADVDQTNEQTEAKNKLRDATYRLNQAQTSPLQRPEEAFGGADTGMFDSFRLGSGRMGGIDTSDIKGKRDPRFDRGGQPKPAPAAAPDNPDGSSGAALPPGVTIDQFGIKYGADGVALNPSNGQPYHPPGPSPWRSGPNAGGRTENLQVMMRGNVVGSISIQMPEMSMAEQMGVSKHTIQAQSSYYNVPKPYEL